MVLVVVLLLLVEFLELDCGYEIYISNIVTVVDTISCTVAATA